MRLLSFDTSTSDLHVCLCQPNQVKASLVVRSNPADRQYAAGLLIPTIEKLLQEANWQKADLDLIVVGVGPGSFTGVRTAVVTARTIAQALNLPLLAVSIMECYVLERGASAMVVLNAGRDQFFAAAYEIIPSNQTKPAASNQLAQSKDIACTVAPVCLNREAIFEMLKNHRHCLVDTSCLPLLQGAPANLESLPDLHNIAILQSKLAFDRLSLSMAQAGLGSHSSLLKSFPYDQVQPLYLRSASVTLKKPH